MKKKSYNKRLKKSISLIKNIVDSSLLFMNPKFNIFTSYSTAKFNLIFINPLEFIKNIKQLIRGLQYLEKKRHSRLYIEGDEYTEDFLDVLDLLDFGSKIEYLTKLCKKKTRFFSAIYIYLKQDIFTSTNLKFLFKKEHFLTYSMNSSFETVNSGFYKFYVELDEIEKFIFMAVIINIFFCKRNDFPSE